MQDILSQYSPRQVEKAKKIRAIICDVDGVLTDGGIIYDDSGREYKKFNVKDGQVVRLLQSGGLLTGTISARKSEVVKFRCREMNLDFHYHGIKDKYLTYLEIRDTYGLEDHEIAYLGDDIIDLPVLAKCGFSVVPSDAMSYVKSGRDLVTRVPGGGGVLREAADFILAAQGLLEALVAGYKEP